MSTEIERAKTTKQKLWRQMESLDKKYRAIRKEYDALDSRINRLELHEKLAALVGQPVKLKPGCVRSTDKLHDTIGTLTKLRRTNAQIDFGDRGVFFVPMGWVTSAGTVGIQDGFVMKL